MPAKTGAIMKNNPGKTNRDQTLAMLRQIEGKTLAQIAAITGLHKSTLSHIYNNDEDVKALMEQAQKAQVLLLPKAIQEHANLLDSEDDSIKLRSVELTYVNTGIKPTHTQSPYIQNLYIQQNNILDPQITSIFKRYFAPSAGDTEAIEVQPEE